MKIGKAIYAGALTFASGITCGALSFAANGNPQNASALVAIAALLMGMLAFLKETEA